MNRRFLPLLLIALAVLAVPTDASAQRRGCLVDTAKVTYEDGAVQTYVRKRRRSTRLVACSRRSGRAYVVGVEQRGAEDISASVRGVVAGRWLWTAESFSYAESADVEEHRLTDLKNGRFVSVKAGGDDGTADVIATAGALAFADGTKLVLHRIGGEPETLDQGTITAPAFSGKTLYWFNGTVAKSLALEAAPAGPPAATPRIRRKARCLPKGRRVVVRDSDVIVTRTSGGALSACRLKTGRQVALPSDPEAVTVADDRLVVVLAAGALVVIDTANGRTTRRAAPASEGGYVAGSFAWADPEGVSVIDRAGTRRVVQGAATDLALTRSATAGDHVVLYWTLDGQPAGLDLTA